MNLFQTIRTLVDLVMHFISRIIGKNSIMSFYRTIQFILTPKQRNTFSNANIVSKCQECFDKLIQ